MSNQGGTWSAKVNSALDSELKAYKETKGLSKSEVVRELLRQGIQAEHQPPWWIEYLMAMAPFFTAVITVAALFYHFTPYFDSAALLIALALFTFFVNVVPLLWYSYLGNRRL